MVNEKKHGVTYMDYKKINRIVIDFNKKIRGFDTGNIIGLESKTSSPIQVIREDDKSCTGFDNLFVVGEGSGYAGGIISSAADGIKAALSIIEEQS